MPTSDAVLLAGILIGSAFTVLYVVLSPSALFRLFDRSMDFHLKGLSLMHGGEEDLRLLYDVVSDGSMLFTHRPYGFSPRQRRLLEEFLKTLPTEEEDAP